MTMDRELLKKMRSIIWEQKTPVTEAVVLTNVMNKNKPEIKKVALVTGLNSPLTSKETDLPNVPGSKNVGSEKDIEASVKVNPAIQQAPIVKVAPVKKVEKDVPTTVKDINKNGANDLITNKPIGEKSVTKIVGEGKIPKEYNMANPQDMIDLLEAQKTHGAKVDLVAKELFGFNTADLNTDQWGKVKKVLDLVANHKEDEAAKVVATPADIAPAVEATEDAQDEKLETPAEEALEEKKEVKK